MLTSKSLILALLSFYLSLITALPVAEPGRIPKFDNTQDTSSSTIVDLSRSPESPSRRNDRQLPSFESGQQGSASSLAHALGLSPPSEVKEAEKRDDIRKYDPPSPQGWAFEDYRAIYLAGLSRIERERGGKSKQRRSSHNATADISTSKPTVVEKRDNAGKYSSPDGAEPTNTVDANDTTYVDNHGLTMDDYMRFFRHHIDSNWVHWTLEDWQNMNARLEEFVASGGQVLGGDRKRSDHSGMFRLSWEDYANLINRYSDWVASGGQVGGGDRKRDQITHETRSMWQDWTNHLKGLRQGGHRERDNTMDHKRDDISKYDGQDDYDTDDEEEEPTLIPLEHEGMVPRSQSIPNSASRPDRPDGTSIGELIAAEEASVPAHDASDQEKRDNMYKYPGGLDDWDDWQLSELFCEDRECPRSRYPITNLQKKEPDMKQKRDDMGRYDDLKYDDRGNSYDDVLDLMEKGLLSSRSQTRSHARDLSNFPSWAPADDPSPPQIPPEAASSRKEKRNDMDIYSDSMIGESQYDGEGSWLHSITSLWRASQRRRTGRGRPKLRRTSLHEALNEDGRTESRNEKRDSTSQYKATMIDEDAWIDIYRNIWLYHLQRNGYPKQRRSANPDTILIHPIDSGLKEVTQATTMHDSNTPQSTSLISLAQASPGPGYPQTQPPAAVMSSAAVPQANPSALFYPFGPLLPLGPNQPPEPADRKRDGTKEDIPEGDWDAFDQWLIREHAKRPGKGPVKEKRDPNPSPTASRALLPEASPDISIPKPSSLPLASSSFSRTDIMRKRDSTANYRPAHSVQDWANEDWEAFDNWVTFQEEDRLKSKRGDTHKQSPNSHEDEKERRDRFRKLGAEDGSYSCTDEEWAADTDWCFLYGSRSSATKETRQDSPIVCQEYDADPSLNLSAGCLCSETPVAQPILPGPSPCAYTSLPKAKRAEEGEVWKGKRDDQSRYDDTDEWDDSEENAIYDWVMGGGGRDKEKRGESSEVTAGMVQQKEEEKHEEEEQHEEGLQQEKMEQDGGMMKRDSWKWVTEEDELTENLGLRQVGNKRLKESKREVPPERDELNEDIELLTAGSDNVRRNQEHTQMPTNMEGTEVAKRAEAKRHCGRSDLPEGYGDNVTNVCG